MSLASHDATLSACVLTVRYFPWCLWLSSLPPYPHPHPQGEEVILYPDRDNPGIRRVKVGNGAGLRPQKHA